MSSTTEKYEAVVSNNEDDEKRGRIRVVCAGLMGDEDSELPMWIEPVLDWGWFFVPDIGEIVEIEVLTSSSTDEGYDESSIDSLSPKWRGRRFFGNEDGDAVDQRAIAGDFTKTNYGKRRGFATPHGHVLMFDDTEGDTRIYLTWVKDRLEPGAEPQDANRSRVELEPDGSLKVSLLNKHSIHLQTEGNKLEITLDEAKNSIVLDATNKIFEILMNGQQSLTLDSGKVEVKTGGGASVVVNGNAAAAAMKVGTGGVHAAIYEVLKTFWDGAFTAAVNTFNGHVHANPSTYVAPLIPLPGPPVPVVPVTVPPVPVLVVPPLPPGVQSNHVEMPPG
jgi:hypothetical protein